MAQKAYILTHHWVPNFGANLQAYATVKALKARGIEPFVVDFRPNELVHKYALTVPAEQGAIHEHFVSVHLPLTRRIQSQGEFEALCEDAPADLYVTGSDAVFRLSINSARADLTFPNPYWLTVARGSGGAAARKIALAPSAMGTSFKRMPGTTRAGVRRALDEMALVSVRDAWTERQLRAVGYSGSIEMVSDPVFSLRREIAAARQATLPTRPYIVLSTQGRASRDWVVRFTALAATEGYDTLALPSPEGVCDEGTTRRIQLPLSPVDWMAAIARSAGYVGGRFHPVVVSLLAGVPVVAFDLYHSHPLNRTRSKTWLLLREFGAAHCCHGARFHRFLTPEKVWRQLEEQNRIGAFRNCKVLALEDALERFFELAFGPIICSKVERLLQ